MHPVKETRSRILPILTLFTLMMFSLPLALWSAEVAPTTEGKTMIVYPTSRFVTLNAACFRQTACEQLAVSLLKNTPGITNVMSYSRQGAIMADFEKEKVKPEELAQQVAKLMAENGFGNVELRTTGSRMIPNTLTVRLLPTRVMASSERFA